VAGSVLARNLAILGVALVSSLVPFGRARAEDPALDYMLNCQGCHLADGHGTPGSVPALAGSVARFLNVPGGREYLGRVPGVAQAALEPGATAALLSWVVMRFDREHLPADFQPYAAEEIVRMRRSPLVDVDRVRASLVAQMPPAMR
jgi:hypothetical protein